jgi:hypothetical protein
MAFLVRYGSVPIGFTTVLPIHPRPTEVEYPEFRSFKSKVSKDGSVVIQRPLKDSRPRKWAWKRYRPYMTEFMNMWAVLESLETKAMWDAGFADPTIEIWEDETGKGGFGTTTDGFPPDLITYTNLVWTKVKIIQAHQAIASGGGPVVFDTSFIDFIIVDEDYSSF